MRFMPKKSIIWTTLFCCLFFVGTSLSVFAAQADTTYHHILVISDFHYPTKSRTSFDAETKARVIANKEKVIGDISKWKDVELFALLGDYVADGGSGSEYAAAKELMGRLQKPFVAVAGNHEYSYVDNRDAKGKLAMASPEMRKAKYNQFKDMFGITGDVYQSRVVGKYLLIFLNPDVDTKQLVEMNQRQMDWLKAELAAHPNMPTIVFCHAPLLGTLLNYEEDINEPKKVAQPVAAISEILEQNPQVFMWVSGHTHTCPETPSFNHPVNLYQGRVINIHNPSWEQETIWTNSLFLFPDKVVVRTFNHNEGRWVDSLDRVIQTSHIGKETRSLRPAM